MCLFIYVHVCIFVYMHVEARGCHCVSSSITLNLIFWDKVSHLSRSSLVQLDWLASKHQESSFLCLQCNYKSTTTAPGFSHRLWRLNLGPCVCMAILYWLDHQRSLLSVFKTSSMTMSAKWGWPLFVHLFTWLLSFVMCNIYCIL